MSSQHDVGRNKVSCTFRSQGMISLLCIQLVLSMPD